jgi:Cu/Ag efflux protein CusF
MSCEDNGTQLTIPATLNVQRDNLKEGAIVKANFEERDGRKVVTSLQVTPAH